MSKPLIVSMGDVAASGGYYLALAGDKVWLSCTIILPLRTQGASGSPVRPVAIGAPAQR